mmetsp:Transcript_19647/g.26424  ORF Transcript_19647/g.26424 Transcript_19647/m.26424 type:complete len:87 (+) Transcript_19647:185-445(+)
MMHAGVKSTGATAKLHHLEAATKIGHLPPNQCGKFGKPRESSIHRLGLGENLTRLPQLLSNSTYNSLRFAARFENVMFPWRPNVSG